MKRTLYNLFFSCLLVNLCHSCLNFTHHDVTFNATNFEYMLQWNKEHLPSDVLFSVQYKRYGQTGWSLFPECQNITEVYCNLTNAITGDVEDFMEHQYFGRVRASARNCYSDWVMSKRLNPRDDTFLVLPKLNYIEHTSSVTILVSTPSLALRSKDNKPMTVEELYRDQSFQYHLSFSNTEKQDVWHKPQKDNRFEVSGLSPNTEYNGSVYIMIGDKRKSDVQNFVVKTLPDHSFLILIVSLIVIFAALLGTVMLYFCCEYIRHQAKPPSSLDLKKVARIQIMTAKKEKCSTCAMGLFPSMFPPMNYPALTPYRDQSGKAQPIAYTSQFQSSVSNTDSPLLLQSSNLQENNIMADSTGNYGGLYEDSTMEYRCNNTPDLLNKTTDNSESELQVTVLNKDSGTLNGLENNGNFFTLFSLLNQKPDNDLEISLELMSSVVVSDTSEFIGQEERTETHPPVLLSDVMLPGFPNNPVENASENRLSEHGSSHYTLQRPVEDSQLSFTNETFIFEQPYRFQQ